MNQQDHIEAIRAAMKAFNDTLHAAARDEVFVSLTVPQQLGPKVPRQVVVAFMTL